MQWCSVFNLVIARPVRKPVVAIRLSNVGITDSHATFRISENVDIGHWLGMTGKTIQFIALFRFAFLCLRRAAAALFRSLASCAAFAFSEPRVSSE